VDLSKPVTLNTILGAIVLIFILIAIGLMVVRYYKKR